MIKNVIFDIGGVLLHFDRSDYLSYFNFDEDTEKKLISLFTHKNNSFHQTSLGQITHAEFVKDAKHQFPELCNEIDMITNLKNMRFMMPPHTKTFELVKKLKNQGKKVYIISNIEENSIDYIKTIYENFETYFDGIIYSCRVGMLKPDPEIFIHTLNKFNLKAEETLFVDDSIKNIDSANNLKINTFHFNYEENGVENLEILLK